MGFKGDIVLAFGNLIEDLYKSHLACFKSPKKFKKALGRHHE